MFEPADAVAPFAAPFLGPVEPVFLESERFAREVTGWDKSQRALPGRSGVVQLLADCLHFEACHLGEGAYRL